ncbi:hypothetical protein GCM10011487_42440 [Steroidobacter agaridevorans]|uniref:Uncharacterized protein n=2 Tax=Steroidobacter agaridevorans TaxID=2695856 RepID=A0A829YG60_9GAMM|nr:hypothetical protein GCM10011487_42440 [Steroidobacter agaridevorans]
MRDLYRPANQVGDAAVTAVVITVGGRMASKRKNSLVANINRRKRAGKSRPKSRSTVSKESYRQMQKGWPKSGTKKAAKKQAAKKK